MKKEENTVRKEIERLEELVQWLPSEDMISKLDVVKEKLEEKRKNKIEGLIIRSRAK